MSTTVQAVTFRNYRSYGSAGATIPLTNQFTAIIGVNNTGKTTLLRSFWELREIYRILAASGPTDSSLHQLLMGGIGWRPTVLEGERVISTFDENSEPRIRIEFSTTDQVTPATVKFVEIVIHRNGSTHLDLGMADNILLSGAQSINPIRQGEVFTHFDFQPNGSHDQYPVDWLPVQSALGILAKNFYIGAFRNAINSGQAPHYDLQVGKGFIDAFDEYQNGPNPLHSEEVNRMAKELGGIFGFSEFQVGVSRTTDGLIFSVDGKSFRGSELGAGIMQFVIVAVNVLINRPEILLIDEPELNLHPALQSRFLALLAKYTNKTVIFSTHSLGLARSVADEVLVSTRDSSNKSILTKFLAQPSPSLVLGELGYGGLNDTAFKAVLLVEGPTDFRALKTLLIKYGIHDEVVVVPMGGDELARGGRFLELNELTRLSENIFAIVDSERSSENEEPIAVRLEFKDSCERANIKCHILERRAIENYLSLPASRAVLRKPAGEAFGFYELPHSSWSWPKNHNWRIIEAMDKSDFENTDLGDFIELIASAVRGVA